MSERIPAKRQFVLFLTDTQSTEMIGCYGRPEMQTPNLDRLAGEGLRFERAYTTQPVCGPARSAIFTGMYPHATGVLANDMAPSLDVPSIGQRLQAEGIRTAYIGKWHLDGTDYFGNGRCPAGWDPDYWFDGRCYLESLGSDEERDLSRLVLGARDLEEHGIKGDFTMAHRITERAISFIEAHREEDFLLVVSIDEPHHPFITPQPFLDRFEGFKFRLKDNIHDSLEDKPLGQREWAEHVRDREDMRIQEENGEYFLQNDPFFACNSFCDYEIGRVLEKIDSVIPDALVTFTSDHGDMLASHRLAMKGPACYEEVARIPFIMRCPDVVPGGSVSESLVSHVDIVPTILDWFGLKAPPILHGVSLLATCRDPKRNHRDIVHFEFNRFEVDHDGFGAFTPIRCAFDGRYKLAVNLLDSDELYDLETDPLEMVNRINDPDAQQVRERLLASIVDWMNTTRDPFRGPHWQRRSWRPDPGISSWGGPTRPRPADGIQPATLLYETGHPVDKPWYPKG